MLSGSAELTVSQPEAVFSALLRGGKGFGIIAAPVNRKDWFLMGRPEIKSLSDLKGKTLGFGGLRVGEHWYTVDLLAQHGVQPTEYNSIVIGTSEPRFAALQNGSIAATTLYQPTAQLAIKAGMKVLYEYKDLPARAPAIVYTISRKFAAEKDHGQRIARALVRSHTWLRDPANRSEAISIVSKYTRVAPDLLGPVYELYLGPDGIMTPDGAVELEGLKNTLAVMAKHKAIPAGASIELEQYMIPKELGGLYR
jgi:NitT/TauT family transport system substrate-binding protein